MDLLVEGGHAYVEGALKKTGILIQDGIIKEVGSVKVGKDVKRIDATGKIVLPGFVNTHTHIAMGGLRGYGEGLPLHRWLREKIWPREERLTSKEVLLGAQLSLCELIRSGVTSICDMYLKEMDSIVGACNASGMRAFLAYSVLDGNGGTKEQLATLERFVKDLKARKNNRLVPVASAHSPYAASPEGIVGAKKIAKKHGIGFTIHTSETRKEVFDILTKTGKYPVEYLDSLGVLDENTLLAHASYVTKREIRVVKERKSAIAHCPVSNLKLATGGICPLYEYANAGVRVSIGTDGAASNNSLNYFESLKVASLLQKHQYWKAELFTGQEMLDIGTTGGARALGYKGGVLKKGAVGDIIILKKQANLAPTPNILENIVYAGGPSNVETVVINGKIVMEGGIIATLNEETIIDEVSAAKR